MIGVVIFCLFLSIFPPYYFQTEESDIVVLISSGSFFPNLVELSDYLPTMKEYGINHHVINMEMRIGQFDTPILAFDGINVVWNDRYWNALARSLAFADSLGIYTDLVLFSQCLLEDSPERWEKNLWNRCNGGPIPGGGENFFCLEWFEETPENWQQWNTYYQLQFLRKVAELEFTTCSPMWEIDQANSSETFFWFYIVGNWIKKYGLVSAQLTRSSEYGYLEFVDYILTQNKGLGDQFLIYGKPVVNVGPYAHHEVHEPTFMYQCCLYGINPSLNSANEFPSWSLGHEYARRLQEFFLTVETWENEPGEEIAENSLPSPLLPYYSSF